MYEKNMKNRKLFLNEYDDDGNLLESRELNNDLLGDFVCTVLSRDRQIDIVRKSVREKFTDKEWNIIYYIKGVDFNVYHYASKFHGMDFEDDDVLKLLRDIFDSNSEDKISFAIREICYKGFKCKLASPFSGLSLGFMDAIKFINSRHGIYYAVNNYGERTYDFVDERPTKKQAEYRRKKYGDRIVYMDFIDFKEYSINEDDLY